MTLDQCLEYVRKSNTRHTIYRLPGWAPGVWGVTLRNPEDMPKEAIIHKQEDPLQVTRMLF